MQKTTSISIGGHLFHIEDDAYRALEAYLETLRAHFAHEPAREEILSDIEGRLAELFLASSTSSPLILRRDIVDRTIKTMGYPEEISDEPARAPRETPAASTPKPPASAPRRLYRDPETKIVSGVCAGIAAYFGIDPVIPRAIAGGLFFLGLFSAAIPSLLIGLIYFILAVFIPEATTPAQRMEMHGEPVTVQSLSERARTEAVRVQSRGEALLRKLVNGFGRFSSALVRVSASLLGLLLILLGFAGAFGSLFGGAVLLSSIDLYIANELRSLVSDPLYYLGVISLATACFIPSFALLLAGVSLVRRRSAFTVSRTVSLVGVWVIAAIATLVIGINRLPSVVNAVEKEREAHVITREFQPLPTIQAINIDEEAYHLTVTPSSTTGYVVSGDDRLAQHLRVEVRDGVLHLSQNKEERICVFCRVSPLRVTVYSSSSLDRITLGGAVRATVTRPESTPLQATLEDASRLTLTGRTDRLTLHAKDASTLFADDYAITQLDANLEDVARADLRIEPQTSVSSTVRLHTKDSARATLHGTTESAQLTIEDVSRVLAEELVSVRVEALLRDAGRAMVHATTELHATTYDVSHLTYVGTPSSTRFSSQEASSISRE